MRAYYQQAGEKQSSSHVEEGGDDEDIPIEVVAIATQLPPVIICGDMCEDIPEDEQDYEIREEQVNTVLPIGFQYDRTLCNNPTLEGLVMQQVTRDLAKYQELLL